MPLKPIYLTIIIFLFSNACKNQLQNPIEKPIASVGNKYLYKSELSSVMPNNLTYADSVRRANDYIMKWVRRELMLKTAEENLSYEQKNVQRELEEYRASLIIHRYKQEFINQRLDTLVTEKDIQDYYNNNSERFILQQNIIKGIYLEVPKDIDSSENIRKWLTSDEISSTTELETYSYQYALKFDYFVEKWLDFNLIKSRLPVSINDPIRFLKENKYVKYSDSNNNYYLSIKEFKLIGEKAPYNFVKDQIENLILNNRKLMLIKELERNVFEKGKEENLFIVKE